MKGGREKCNGVIELMEDEKGRKKGRKKEGKRGIKGSKEKEKKEDAG